MTSRNKQLLQQCAKYIIFSVIILLLYVLQSTPGFLSVFSIKPVFVIPFCITLSVLSDEWQSIFLIILCGMLSDLSGGRTFGVFSLLLVVCAFIAQMAVNMFLQVKAKNVYILNLCLMVFMLTIDFLFGYVLAGFSSTFWFYIKNVLLLSAYSSLFSMPFYYVINFINSKFVRYNAR